MAGAYVVEPERKSDERGFFARTFCRSEFEQKGLVSEFVQCSVSFNRRAGTLRGMHYQARPYPETKLVRCTRGRMLDVIVDLRRTSGTFREWCAVEAGAENRCAVYVPQGFAHGFLTLEDDTEVFYQISAFYHPESARGVRWDDPAFAIEWPFAPRSMSERDAGYPDFDADSLDI